jgi:hypothetical protein
VFAAPELLKIMPLRCSVHPTIPATCKQFLEGSTTHPMEGDFVKTQLLKYWLLWSDRGCYGDYALCWYPSNQQLVPGRTVEGFYWDGLKDIKDVIEWMSVSCKVTLTLTLTLSGRTPCGGGLEYFTVVPASRKRRQKGNPVPGGITGPPCYWGI